MSLELRRMNRLTCSSGSNSRRVQVPSGLNPETSKARQAAPIRVLLADDHPVVRWGLTCFLAPRTDVVVVGEAVDGRQAVSKARELSPDIVLMDIEMPQLNGLSATELLHRERPEIKVLLISMHPYTAQMQRILQSGARGFLLKDARPEVILAAIHKVMAGETCFSSSIAQQALRHLARTDAEEFQTKALSYREREVLIGIAEGLSNKQLGLRLGISARTVETHRGHIMQKLNIHSVAGLTRFAISRGLVIMETER